MLKRKDLYNVLLMIIQNIIEIVELISSIFEILQAVL